MGTTVTQIKDQKSLQEYLSGVERELATLRAAVKTDLSQRAKRLSSSSPWSREKAEGFGRFIKAIYTGDQATLGSYQQKAALGTPLRGDTTTGSYLVPTEYLDEVIRQAEEQSELMRAVRRVEMKSRTTQVPVKSAGFSFTYLSTETTDVSEQSPTFGQETLTANTYAGYIGLSEALMEDSLVNLGEYFGELVAEGWATKFDSEFMSGSGTPITGILADTDVNAVTMDTGETSFDAIGTSHIQGLIGALDTRAKRKNAAFVMHPTILDYVADLKDANGRFIYREGSDAVPRTLRGYPVLLSDAMPDTGDSAADTAFVAFGDPKTLLFGDRISLELKYFDATSYAVTNTQVFFRARVRAGFNIPLPASWAKLKTAAS